MQYLILLSTCYAPNANSFLSLHDALPILAPGAPGTRSGTAPPRRACRSAVRRTARSPRSEEHTSELQSRVDLVCRLLLEKKKMEISDSQQVVSLVSASGPADRLVGIEC